MKLSYKIFLFSALLLLQAMIFAQPGKPASPAGRYAGAKKSLVDKMYTSDMSELKGWENLGGSVVTALDEPEMFLVDIFKKGTTRIFIFTLRVDTSELDEEEVAFTYKILDVVEVKNVLTTQEIKTGLCRVDKKENSFIVALIQPRNIQYNKAIKAWRFNRDKRRVELVTASKVDCMNEGYGE